MNTKQRDRVYQHWSGVIQRETRDLATLDLVAARALTDRAVRGDSTLESMIRADIENRRVELEQEIQIAQSSAATAKSRLAEPSVQSEPTPAAIPEKVRAVFKELAQTLSTSLEDGDEEDTRAVFAKIRALQKQSPEVIPATIVRQYEQRVKKLRDHLEQLKGEIVVLAEQAVSASRAGSKQDLARLMRRLTAIHVAHPRLLDEPGLEDVRRDVSVAADERRQDRRTTQELLVRQRAIAAEIKKLAATIHEFHRVACAAPDTSEEFRAAEATYLRTIQKVRTYDTDWFSGVVLELADLLAQWTVPPLGAEGQIDRFLDGISAGLAGIRAEMRQIETEQGAEEGNEQEPGPP